MEYLGYVWLHGKFLKIENDFFLIGGGLILFIFCEIFWRFSFEGSRTYAYAHAPAHTRAIHPPLLLPSAPMCPSSPPPPATTYTVSVFEDTITSYMYYR